MTNSQKLINDYQRLEFLGDRVLNLIVSHYLFKKFPYDSAGDLTNKLKFTSNDNLEEIIDKFPEEFRKELFRSKCGFKADAQELKADDIEAFIGNYYLEHGLEASINYFNKFFAKEIDAFDPCTDYISMLQIHTQKELKIVPDYKLIEEEMVQNNQHMFYFYVLVGKDLAGSGSGTSHAKAKK